MRRLEILGAAVLAVFACSIIAASAQAEGPFFARCAKTAGGKFEDAKCSKVGTVKEWERTRYAKGETATLSAVGSTFTLATGVQTLVCKKSKAKAGAVVVGSGKGTAGSVEAAVEFEECTVTGNGEGCKVVGAKITTELLVATLDKEKAVAAKGEKLLVSFRPAKGSVFVKVKFEGTCTVTETAVELNGGVKAKLGVAGVLDLEKGCTAAQEKELGELCKEKHVPVKLLENEELAKIGLIFFPKTLLKTEFVEENEVVSEVKEGLAAFGKAVTEFTGHTTVELPGVEDWGVFGA